MTARTIRFFPPRASLLRSRREEAGRAVVGRAVPGEPRLGETPRPTSSATVLHGPSSCAAPFHVTGASGTFHCAFGGSNATFAKSGVPSAFIGNDAILKSFVATCGSSPSA